jgi:hypothetical protein
MQELSPCSGCESLSLTPEMSYPIAESSLVTVTTGNGHVKKCSDLA